MTTLRYLLRIVGLSPWLFALSSVLSIGVFVVPLLFGAILREFFDMLAGDAPAGFEVRTLAVLYLLVILVTFVTAVTHSAVEEGFWTRLVAVLQRNLFRGILRSPRCEVGRRRATWSTGSARTPMTPWSPCSRRGPLSGTPQR